jgi:hypothetical protein
MALRQSFVQDNGYITLCTKTIPFYTAHCLQNKTLLYSELNDPAQSCYLNKDRSCSCFSAHCKYWYARYISALYQVAKVKHYPNSRIFSGADKSLSRPTSLSIVCSVQGTGGSPSGPDPENRVGDQDIGSPGRPVSYGLQVAGEPFHFWSG